MSERLGTASGLGLGLGLAAALGLDRLRRLLVEARQFLVVVTEELVKLRKSGLLPVEVGMPRALRALGVAEEGVQRYVAAAVEREAKRKRISD